MRVVDFLKSRLLTGAILFSCLGLLFVAHTVSTARATWTGGAGGGGNLSTDARAALDGIVAEARVVTYPGGRVTLGSENGGRIVRFDVQEGQVVHTGELIAQINAEEYRAQLDELTARLAEIDADTHLSEFKLQRIAELSSRGGASLFETEQQRRDVASAQARHAATAAQADRIRVQLNRCSILSPIDGTITARLAQPFEVVQPGSPIVTIADLSHTRIEAEVNEFDGANVTVGQPAFVTAEGFPGVRWAATVEEVPQVVVTRQLRPQDPGRPTDTGVILVKLALRSPAPLKLGQRVEVTIQRAMR